MDLINDPHAASPRTTGKRLGELLLQRGLITEEQLERALKVQAREKVRLGQILVSLGFINRLALAQALAEQLGLPFRNMLLDPPPDDLVRQLDAETLLELGAVPLMMAEDHAVVGFTDPLDNAARRTMERLLGKPVRPAVISEYDLEWVLEQVYREERLKESISGLYYRHPTDSAFGTPTDRQILAIYLILATVVGGFLMAPMRWLVIINVAVTGVYLAIILYKALVLWQGIKLQAVSQDDVCSAPEGADIPDSELPTYTILVPLFREAAVLPTLLKAVSRLDYPRAKLDVKLLFEESDPETLEAAKRLHPPGYFKFIVVPDGEPRTKPKACNYGLIQATGEYCVIYDAEDVPEPGQLRKAVAAFRVAPDDVVCLQAALNFYNPRQNLLTRWFSAEYSQWFDIYLPGLMAARSPIPLGGTSNHFITEKLRELGAWDPFNVTEDVDLGMRLHKMGYRTEMFNSTTYEEATSQLHNWIRQRSRWVKGYIQTWLVHMRNLVRLWRELGPRSFLAFQATVGGSFFVLLVNPWYWFITFVWLVSRWDIINLSFPGMLYYLSLISMIVGNFCFLYVNLATTYARRYYDLLNYILICPFYWLFMSFAAWKGFLQLITRPFYWEKTVHGMADRQPILDGEGLMDDKS
ncbi:MAG: glycosyltransferase [Chloroflexi bacterium]|nr:glycosyltransferase [Chloroflexota bacterium]